MREGFVKLCYIAKIGADDDWDNDEDDYYYMKSLYQIGLLKTFCVHDALIYNSSTYVYRNILIHILFSWKDRSSFLRKVVQNCASKNLYKKTTL